MVKRAPKGYRITQWADGMYHVYSVSAAGVCIAETATRLKAIEAARKDKNAQQGVHADAGDSAVSTSSLQASADTTSQTVTQTTQRG